MQFGPMSMASEFDPSRGESIALGAAASESTMDAGLVPGPFFYPDSSLYRDPGKLVHEKHDSYEALLRAADAYDALRRDGG